MPRRLQSEAHGMTGMRYDCRASRFSPLQRPLLFTLFLLAFCGCGDGETPEPDEPIDSQESASSLRNECDGATSESDEEPISKKPSLPDHGADQDPVGELPTLKPIKKNVYRLAYERADHDEKHLATFGLSRFSTKHLELVTDISREQAEPLVPLIDSLQTFLDSYFGKLPPALDGSEYRITGYVMQDRDRFVQARLARADQLDAFHGRQVGARFWMNNQTLDYYRRHLFLHEAVHCYMRHLPGEAEFPMWYLEGMAEMIATHLRGVDEATATEPGQVTFNVMPADRMRFRGLERIAILKRDVRKNGVRSVAQIRKMTGDSFKNSVESYAWCWAFCRFLDSHPTTQMSFRRLATSFLTSSPRTAINTFFATADENLESEWSLFVSNIEHGYDFDANTIVFQQGRPFDAQMHVAEVDARKSWQTTLLKVQAGHKYQVFAAGQFILEPGEKPWISEANGVSIRYHQGQPLGRLLGTVHVAGEPHSMLATIPLGNDLTFTAQKSGTLYLRVNDRANSLRTNTGKLSVTIRRVPD